jgi:hypothetical protein
MKEFNWISNPLSREMIRFQIRVNICFVYLQGADSLPHPLRVAKTGKNILIPSPILYV